MLFTPAISSEELVRNVLASQFTGRIVGAWKILQTRLTMSWYLNESAHPNVRCDPFYNFWTISDIEPDDELTVDHSSYSE